MLRILTLGSIIAYATAQRNLTQPPAANLPNKTVSFALVADLSVTDPAGQMIV